MFNPAPVPIRRIDEEMGTVAEGAGVSVTTGNQQLDIALRWGFWISMGLVGYRMYRVLRYDEPFFASSSKLPPAWQMNPDQSNEEHRETLIRYGLPNPPDEYEIKRIRYSTKTDDWYILVKSENTFFGGDWYWYDPRDRGWKFLPRGPIQ